MYTYLRQAEDTVHKFILYKLNFATVGKKTFLIFNNNIV